MNTEREELINKILEYKLYVDDRGNLYGDEFKDHLSHLTGAWQFPDELADLLLFLKDKNITSFLNIGTFNGVTFHIIADYLSKLSEVKCITTDPFDFKPEKNPNYIYEELKSDEFKNQVFDLVFIDGDHRYEFTKNDYYNIGIHSKYCVFHDIDDDLIRYHDQNKNGGKPYFEGGVPRFWDEIKEGKNYLEFKSNKKTRKIMGIGILIH